MEKLIFDKREALSWCCGEISKKLYQQIKEVCDLPFLYKHFALMADGHLGYGVPIGGVFATERTIVPNAAGKDIGCGMHLGKFSKKADQITTEEIRQFCDEVRTEIPVGFSHNQKPIPWKSEHKGFELSIEILKQEAENSEYQMGTLGGGNHFIELQKDNLGNLYVMIHSGSRNLGLKIADCYHKIAQSECAKWNIELPHKDLAYLPTTTNEGYEYYQAMTYALEFAHLNRLTMLGKVAMIMQKIWNADLISDFGVHHNYARRENHFGKNVWVHRKGAISAKPNEPGIVPGSQGTSSFITVGKGNVPSFQSCAHGAGRKMGRNEANKTLNKADCEKAMEGIVYKEFGVNKKGKNTLDEAPQAYKDINEVMLKQSDLITPITELFPLGVVKA